MLDDELDLAVGYPVKEGNFFPPPGALIALESTIGELSDPSKIFQLIRYGVSCLHAFVQQNFVGPASKDSLETKAPVDLDDAQALENLALSGEPAYPLCRSPSLLYVAKRILIDVGRNKWRTHFPSVSWWACRTCWIWQKLFVDRRSELRDILLDEIKFLDEHASWSSLPHEAKAIYEIEKAIIFGFYYEPEKADVALNDALSLARLNSVHLTGILGRRTKFQTKDVAQLALEDLEQTENAEIDESLHRPRIEFPSDCALNDDTLLDKAQLRSSLRQKPFSPVQECALVAFVENLQRKHFSDDELQKEIEKAYLDRLLHHPVTYVCKYVCLFKRCQLERGDYRRIERALAQAEELVNEFERPHHSLSSRDRLEYFFAVDVPPVWGVRKMEAGLLMKLGCTSEALRIYIDLKLWDEAVECYRKLGMLDRAEAIIKEQLELKETPHLLCLLGDVRNEESWYLKAWELSGKRLARAQASLGMVYFVRKKYDEAVVAFETALALLPLDLKLWYNLGYCAMQIKNYQRAAEAYHRCTTIEGDNFEAWNNLAACYIYLGDKYRAFQILQESIKYNYENWKVWENYVHTGVDTGNFREAISGINRLIDLKGNYADIDVLQILVRVAASKKASDSKQPTDDGKFNEYELDETFFPNLRALFGRLTTKTVNNTALWRLYGDLRRPGDDATDNCDEWEKYVGILHKAHQTALRSSAWVKSDEEVEKVVEYALRLAEAQLKLASLIEISSSDRAKQLSASTRLMLKGLLANLMSSDIREHAPVRNSISKVNQLIERIESA